MALLHHLKVAHLVLHVEPLLAEVADQIARNGKVYRPHDVAFGAAARRDENQTLVKGDAGGSDPQRLTQTGTEFRREHGKCEEWIRGAGRAFGQSADRGAKE